MRETDRIHHHPRFRVIAAAASGKLARFIALRIVLGLATLLAASVVVFGSTQVLPGDAARAILGKTASPERLAVVRKQLHLDRPVVSQYWAWLSGVLRGDMGTSVVQQAPVSQVIKPQIINSAFLVGLAALIAFPGAILLGAFSAYRRDSTFDHVNSVISLGLSALPDFVIALSLIVLTSTTVFHVFPAVSVIDPGVRPWTQRDLVVLPVLTLVIWELPYISRVMRACMVDVLESDYVEAARLNGIPEWKVVFRHAVPNAIIPVIQVIAVQIAFLAGSLVVVEFVFGYAGIGQGLVQAVANRDLPVVQSIAVLVAGVYVVVNVLADIATVLLSPRLRTGFA